MVNYYAGIGSRKTPDYILRIMREFAKGTARSGWVLRSGGAGGADQAFETGCDMGFGAKEIFRSGDAAEWSYTEAVEHIPENRPPFNLWKPYSRSLIARNMMQILGPNGNEPVKLVICWTPADIKDGGGTGYATRCAVSKKIPVYNLHDEPILNKFRKALDL